MKPTDIDEAVDEAKRFIERAATFKAENSIQWKNKNVWGGPRESGALRRASLDLTRALSKMRQSNA